MLLGEHAVLHGRHCLVCAVNQRLHLTIYRRKDSRISIHSELGQLQTDLKELDIQPPFRFILTVLQRFKDKLPHGFDLNIESEFTATVGLGSSAAVTAATILACYEMAGLHIDKHLIFDDGLDSIRAVQGTGSGADLVASVFGGILLYRHSPVSITALHETHPICVIYSGGKTPTTEVIAKVEQKRNALPELFDSIYDMMDKSAVQAAEAIQHKQWQRFGDILNVNQGLMDAIGVSNATLSDIAYALRDDPGILGSKISGSGLGDCVVGWGALQNKIKYQTIPLEISSEGVRFD